MFECQIVFKNLALVSYKFPILINGLYVNPSIPVFLTEVPIQYRHKMKEKGKYVTTKTGVKYCKKECRGFIHVAVVRSHLQEIH